MTTLADAPPREEISLFGSLKQGWIKLPRSIVQNVGPAAQTLGGILNISKRETFVAAGKIAKEARVKVSTCRKHLVTLNGKGWIENAGRERTRSGIPRRTCTIKVTTKTKAALNEYGILPWWVCCYIKSVGCLPWSAKALLSIIMARLAALRKTVEDQEGETNDDDFWGSLDNMGGEDRFRFSLHCLEHVTGLHRESIVDAKRRLASLKIVHWFDGDDRGQLLVPNTRFRVVVTPASEKGRVFLEFKEGSETGQ